MDTKPIAQTPHIQYRQNETKGGADAKANETAGVAKTEQAQSQAKHVVSKDIGVDVEVSQAAREKAIAHRKAFDIAIATPEVREDRVAELKRQIQQGLYKPQPEKIADGILREAVLEHLANQPD